MDQVPNDSSKNKLTRKQFLQFTSIGGLGALLTACSKRYVSLDELIASGQVVTESNLREIGLDVKNGTVIVPPEGTPSFKSDLDYAAGKAPVTDETLAQIEANRPLYTNWRDNRDIGKEISDLPELVKKSSVMITTTNQIESTEGPVRDTVTQNGVVLNYEPTPDGKTLISILTVIRPESVPNVTSGRLESFSITASDKNFVESTQVPFAIATFPDQIGTDGPWLAVISVKLDKAADLLPSIRGVGQESLSNLGPSKPQDTLLGLSVVETRPFNFKPSEDLKEVALTAAALMDTVPVSNMLIQKPGAGFGVFVTNSEGAPVLAGLAAGSDIRTGISYFANIDPDKIKLLQDMSRTFIDPIN